jgi:hypothetical protein
LSACGRPRHGMIPSVALASRRAPSTSAGPQAASRPPNTYVHEPLQRTAALKPRVQFARHRTGRITTPLPSAACSVAAARIAPGRGSLSGSPGYRQVMHTYTVAASVDASASVPLGCPIELTRAAPQGSRPDRVLDWNRSAARHPARATTESTAGLLARGSPPVTAFPGFVPVAMWHGLAAYSCGGSCGIGTWFRTAFPLHSRVRDRRSRPLNGGHPRFVNADALRACDRFAGSYSRAVVDSHPVGTKKGRR